MRKRISESGCADGWSSDEDEVNGVCPDCEMETVDGNAACGCNWSPESCETCGHKGCNGSC